MRIAYLAPTQPSRSRPLIDFVKTQVCFGGFIVVVSDSIQVPSLSSDCRKQSLRVESGSRQMLDAAGAVGLLATLMPWVMADEIRPKFPAQIVHARQ